MASQRQHRHAELLRARGHLVDTLGEQRSDHRHDVVFGHELVERAQRGFDFLAAVLDHERDLGVGLLFVEDAERKLDSLERTRPELRELAFHRKQHADSLAIDRAVVMPRSHEVTRRESAGRRPRAGPAVQQLVGLRVINTVGIASEKKLKVALALFFGAWCGRRELKSAESEKHLI